VKYLLYTFKKAYNMIAGIIIFYSLLVMLSIYLRYKYLILIKDGYYLIGEHSSYLRRAYNNCSALSKKVNLSEYDIDRWNESIKDVKDHNISIFALVLVKSLFFPITIVAILTLKFFQFVKFIVSKLANKLTKISLSDKIYIKEILVLKESNSYRALPEKSIKHIKEV